MKILLVGGGTLGSINPLLAIAKEVKIRKPDIELVFWGSRNLFERKFVEEAGFEFFPIASGKFRRYFSFLNFTDAFKIFYAGFWTLKKLKELKPDLILTAGSFVAVPVAWSAWKLKLPLLMYQQDVELGLANKYISKRAKFKIATSDIAAKVVPGGSKVLGFSVRKILFEGKPENICKKFNFVPSKPVLLVIGGSTGALALNKKFIACLPRLSQDIQILHITGPGKGIPNVKRENYVQVPFINQELPDFYAAADLVISRAGSNVLAELAALKKAAIVVPLPKTHQEQNADYLHDHGILTMSQESLEPEIFAAMIEENIFNLEKLQKLSQNISNIWQTDGAGKIAEFILKQ